MLHRVAHARPLRSAGNACTCFLRCLSTASSSQRDADELELVGNMLAKAMRTSDMHPGWKHSPRRRKQTSDAVPPPAVRWKSPSIERKQFSLGSHLSNIPLDEAIEASSSSTSLQPGCFVELRRQEIVRHAVVLVSKTVVQSPVVFALFTTGELLQVPETDVMFSIPQFVDADMVRRCGTTADVDEHKLAARQAVVKRAREFEREVEDVYNGMSWEASALYSKVKAKRNDEWGEVSTIEAARILHSAPNPPIITLFAVHKHLMNQADKYVAQSAAHRRSNIFAVRPRSHVAHLKNVKKWIHEGHPLLDSFAKKAQTLIAKSRELKTYAGEFVAEPISIDVKFNPSEKEILRVLQLSLDENRSTQVSPYHSLVPSIIKKIRRYDGDIDQWTTLTLLREIGVQEPWDDMVTKNRDFVLTCAPHARTDVVPNSDEESLEPDRHESVRHDFGQLPVFVIDDYHAQELDDGLSFEVDSADPSSYWVHVHVADPTSVISPSHPIAINARKSMATMYLIHETQTMLPPSFSGTGLRVFSENDQQQSKNVLTFSVKLNSEGDILDYKIRPAIVRNVAVMKYDDVDAALGVHTFVPMRPFDPPTEPTDPPDLSSVLPHMGSLRRLWDISEKQNALRLNLPIFKFNSPQLSVTMSPQPGRLRPPGSFEPLLYRGFPQLSYVVYNKTYDYGARGMVAEFMKLACRVASRFCKEHDIPMFRRASTPFEFSDPEDLERALSLRDDRGDIGVWNLSRFSFRTSPAEYTLDVKEHWAMGISADEGYIRVTSPLRRFQDLVAHWQIKSALLPSPSKAPFSKTEVEQIATELTKYEGVAKRAERRHSRFWAHYCIHRFMANDANAGLDPHPLRNIVGRCMSSSVKEARTMTYHTEISLPSLGLNGDLRTESSTGYRGGETVTVNVKRVSMGIFPVLILELAA